jgi:hypothetical protein
MSEPKDFQGSMDSDAHRTPVRVAFVTRRTSPQVQAAAQQHVMTNPEGLLRVVVAAEALLLVLVLVSLLWDAPLEGLADPLQTPNPAKAPWYFLGLQELLHYFPPVIAGVLIPTMVVLALIVIPYFGINIEAEGFWVSNRTRKLRMLAATVIALSVFLVAFDVYAVLIPTLVIAGAMLLGAFPPPSPGRFRRWLHVKPLPFWIMTWFLIVAVVLTAIGTYFRGAGWAWVWPWGQV